MSPPFPPPAPQNFLLPEGWGWEGSSQTMPPIIQLFVKVDSHALHKDMASQKLTIIGMQF